MSGEPSLQELQEMLRKRMAGSEDEVSEVVQMDKNDIAHMHVCMLMRENIELKAAIEEDRKKQREQELNALLNKTQQLLAEKYSLDLNAGRIKLDAEKNTIAFIPNGDNSSDMATNDQGS